jgi:hypothetical protein
MAFAIKAEVRDPRATTFTFTRQKTMYGGTSIAEGDMIFVFASENEGGHGLIARGVVTSAAAIARKPGIARQTPRVSVTIKRTALAKRPLGRKELKPFADWNDGSAGDRAQFQILSAGDQQDRRDLGWSGGVSRRLLPTREAVSGPVESQERCQSRRVGRPLEFATHGRERFALRGRASSRV